MSIRIHRRAAYRTSLAALLALGGCAGGEASRGDDPLRGVERAEQRVAQGPPVAGASERAPVVLNGTPIGWATLHPYLAEAGGRAALDEALLDQLVEQALAEAGRSVGESDVQREYEDLVRVLSRNVGRGVETEALVADMRRAMGLGPHRFRATLERNAKLRALVRDQVEVTEAEVRLAHEVTHGPRWRVRLITTATQREAAEARRALAGLSGEALRVAFAAEALERSTDPSAAAGGLIEPISPSDPAYPSALTQAVAGLRAGEVSPVIALPDAYALVYAEQVLPATGVSLASARGELERDLLARRERLAMERMAARLLERASITVLDPSLDWARGRGR